MLTDSEEESLELKRSFQDSEINEKDPMNLMLERYLQRHESHSTARSTLNARGTMASKATRTTLAARTTSVDPFFCSLKTTKSDDVLDLCSRIDKLLLKSDFSADCSSDVDRLNRNSNYRKIRRKRRQRANSSREGRDCSESSDDCSHSVGHESAHSASNSPLETATATRLKPAKAESAVCRTDSEPEESTQHVRSHHSDHLIVDGICRSLPPPRSLEHNSLDLASSLKGRWWPTSSYSRWGKWGDIMAVSEQDEEEYAFSSSDSESLDYNADNEFECDCEMCQTLSISSFGTNRLANRTGLAGGGQDRLTGEDRESNVDNEQNGSLRSLLSEPFILPSLDVWERMLPEDRNAVLSIMFQNVLFQMVSVYPDLFNDGAALPSSEQYIDSLPLIELSKEFLESEAPCPICLNNFRDEEKTTQLPCSHVFHPLCIRAWLKKSGTCPVCRFELPRR